jgi:beta-glucosidase
MNAWWFDPIFTGSYPADQWKEKGSDVPDITDEEMAVIAQPLDYMGLNIYSGQLVEADETPGSPGYRVVPYPDAHPETTMGWPVNAESIYYGLKHMHDCYALSKYYIMENGCAYDDALDPDGKVEDPYRIDYLRSHIASAHRAVAEGINLAGYFVWSLMDNFEWDRGYSKRFGITYIDYPTGKRILKKSALWYRDVISRNGIG